MLIRRERISPLYARSIAPLNDIGDYKTENSPKKIVVASGIPGNQPAGGISSSSGGQIYYNTSGGSSTTVNVNFGTGYGTVSFSLPLGSRSNTVTGYSANIPNYGFWRLKVDNQYEVMVYTIYKRQWVSDMVGYQWIKWSGGQTQTLYRVSLKTERVS